MGGRRAAIAGMRLRLGRRGAGPAYPEGGEAGHRDPLSGRSMGRPRRRLRRRDAAYYRAIAPNVAKPRSRGRVWITSADPDDGPAIDYRHFTDPAPPTKPSCSQRCASPGKSASQSPWRPSCAARYSPDRRRPQMLTSPPSPARPTRPSTTSAEPAGWAPPTNTRHARPAPAGARGAGTASGRRIGVLAISSVNPVVTVMITAEHAASLIRQDSLSAGRIHPFG